jgi:ribosomal RNA assembly protein
MQEEIKIPQERIAVVIGEKGSTKRKLQRKTKCKIIVSSSEGDIVIESNNSFDVFLASKIIKAIGRGFNPNIALKLLNENYCFELINIRDFSGKSKKQEERIKARVIGTRGKARRNLERMTNTNICIYGKTIGIIGNLEDVSLARRALDKLLKGSPHSNVYKWIEIQKKREEIL